MKRGRQFGQLDPFETFVGIKAILGVRLQPAIIEVETVGARKTLLEP